MSLLVWLQLIEGLVHCLYQLVLCNQELLHLWVVVVGIIGLSVAHLVIAVVVPRVNHLRDIDKRHTYFRIKMKPQTICCDFYLSLLKDKVVDKVPKQSHDSHQALTSIKLNIKHDATNDSQPDSGGS
jgi:hypothetical protein